MLISHPKENNLPAKPLVAHLKNVADYCLNKFISMRLNLSEKLLNYDELKELILLICIFHDFGKATTYFQEYIDSDHSKGRDNLTNHSLLSAIVCYHVVLHKLGSELAAIIAFLVIKRHHGDLEVIHEISDDIGCFKKQFANIKDNNINELIPYYEKYNIDIVEILSSIDLRSFKDKTEDFEFCFIKEINDNDEVHVELFFIVNMLFSLLIDSDKKDAARLEMDYFTGNLEESVSDLFIYLDDCRKKHPDKFNPDIPINKIRNDFLNEIISNKNIIPENHFYSITAPTGIGKTFGCLAFANRLKNLLPNGEGRIIYCLPYTSIIDQNYEEFKNIIEFNKKEKFNHRPSRYLLKHHYLTFKNIENRKKEEDYNYKDYLDDKLFVESWESSMVITTFVQFFHTIIGVKNNMLKKLHNIVNSIVILDEVQNIDPEYYEMLRIILEVFAKKFNVYFLLITATQPEILDKREVIELIDSKKYMTNSLFNRVNLKYSHDITTIDGFCNNFSKTFTGDNGLIVLNTKKAVSSVYEKIQNQFIQKGYKIITLTTRQIPRDRNKLIKLIKLYIKYKKKIIVIATQLIEAGVDLSFKYVYRDYAPFDSIVQVAGRCNRNGEYGILEGKMFLFSLADCTLVYKDILKQFVNDIFNEDESKKNYESKEFYEMSKKYFDKFDFKLKSKKLFDAICDLNYDDDMRDQIPICDFKLIKEYQTESIFILTTKKAQKKMDELFELKNDVANDKISKEEINEKLLRIEKIKGFLKEYQISLYPNELKEYENSTIINEEKYFKYISYDKQRGCVYELSSGFQVKPKKYIGIEQL